LGADPRLADATGARVAACAAVRRIAVQVTASGLNTAVGELLGALRPDAFAVLACDGNQVAGAEIAAGSAVVQIDQEIDAGAGLGTVGQTPIATGILSRRGTSRPPPDYDGGGGEPHELTTRRAVGNGTRDPVEPIAVHGTSRSLMG